MKKCCGRKLMKKKQETGSSTDFRFATFMAFISASAGQINDLSTWGQHFLVKCSRENIVAIQHGIRENKVQSPCLAMALSLMPQSGKNLDMETRLDTYLVCAAA